MFSTQRFTQLLRLTWAQTPRWLLLLPPLAIIGVLIFGIVVDGNDMMPRYGNTDQAFITPNIMLAVMIYGNTIALITIAATLISRHFKNAQSKTDTLSLPVSRMERFSVLAFCCYLLIPLFGLISSIVTFSVIKTVQLLGYYPDFAWMGKGFLFALIPYYLLISPFFALAILRPRQTIMWGLGISAIIGVVVGFILNNSPDFLKDFQYEVAGLTGIPDPKDLYGPSLENTQTLGINPLYGILSSPATYSIYGLVMFVLLLASAWIAFKNHQV